MATSRPVFGFMVSHHALKINIIFGVDRLSITMQIILIRIFPLSSNCPQNRVQDSKKSCWNSKEMRVYKSLFLLELIAKYRFLTRLQKEGKSNPTLSDFFAPNLRPRPR